MAEGERHWRISSQCGTENCVEVAANDTDVILRDSKDPDGAQLEFSIDRWREFVEGVKRGEFERGAGSEPA
jgi:hypothetical protein